jgi:uncharacterized damage-inducible protein DinB
MTSENLLLSEHLNCREISMDKAYFIKLYQYTAWANRQVWDCVMELPADKYYQDLDYSIGAIHIQMVHTMAVEHWWLTFLKEGRIDFLEEDDFPDRESIREKWDAVEAYIMDYLESLTDEELQRKVKPPFWDEDEQPVRVWHALLQVANHSTDHRAQTLAGLHTVGGKTIAQDFLRFMDFEPDVD